MNPFPPSSPGAQFYQEIESHFPELDLVRRQITPSSLLPQIQATPVNKLLGQAITNQPMGEAVKAGLCLAVDVLPQIGLVVTDKIELGYFSGGD